jgi:hypothetical protein
VTVTIVRGGNRQTITVTPEESKDNGFLFQSDDENGVTAPAAPDAPGQIRVIRPPTPTTPMVAPVPTTLFFPGRVI